MGVGGVGSGRKCGVGGKMGKDGGGDSGGCRGSGGETGKVVACRNGWKDCKETRDGKMKARGLGMEDSTEWEG